MRSFAVVTTFNQPGMDLYGQHMIDSFIKNWPKSITLYVYAEKCKPNTHNCSNVVILDADTVLEDLQAFKLKWKDIPKANGVCPWPERRPRDHQKGFKWDAVKFSNKVYSIFHCADICNTETLIWMDADTVCHSNLEYSVLKNIIPEHVDICYLGREKKWPECGLYSINLKSSVAREFLTVFKQVYDDAENGIFTMEEWHDSYVFDEILKRVPVKTLNWSAGIIKGEGHPLINSAWGAFLDHLKGDRKQAGRSKTTDLVLKRTEEYWKDK
jgi:hypothetical protein